MKNQCNQIMQKTQSAVIPWLFIGVIIPFLGTEIMVIENNFSGKGMIKMYNVA